MKDSMMDNMFSDYPDIVNPKQLQNMIGVSEKTVYKLLKQGDIPCRKIGREYRIPKINVIEYITCS